MVKERLQWHPAFQSVLRIEFENELEYLDIQDEYLLSKKPLQIDVVVIKKNQDIELSKNIGRIFKKHNIIEYKAPTDYLSINDYYKVYAYACLYQANTLNVMDIKPEEITITFVSTGYPRKFIQHLEEILHFTILQNEPGIYYIIGNVFAMQLIVVNQLNEANNYWLHQMRDDLKTGTEIQTLVQKYEEKRHSIWHQAVMDVILRANWNNVEEEKEMCDALNELFAKELEESKHQGLSLGQEQGIELAKKIFKLERDGYSLEEIAIQCNLPIERITEILE